MFSENLKGFFVAIAILLPGTVGVGSSLASQTGCTPHARAAVIQNGIEVALCVAENQDQPLEFVLAKCAAENVTPDEIERMFRAQKAATAKAAAAQKAGCGEK